MRCTPRALRDDHVTTVVNDLLEDSVLQRLVPWLFVETVQSAPSHIAYMLLGAYTVNERRHYAIGAQASGRWTDTSTRRWHVPFIRTLYRFTVKV